MFDLSCILEYLLNREVFVIHFIGFALWSSLFITSNPSVHQSSSRHIKDACSSIIVSECIVLLYWIFHSYFGWIFGSSFGLGVFIVSFFWIVIFENYTEERIAIRDSAVFMENDGKYVIIHFKLIDYNIMYYGYAKHFFSFCRFECWWRN